MKKFLSAALVLCMLFGACIMFSSCGKVAEKDLEKNPSEALDEALSNTYSDFFEDELGIYEVLKKTDEKNSVELYFESDDLMGKDLTRVSATLYSDLKNTKYVFDASAAYKGDTLNARINLDKEGVVVSGKSLFGADSAYALKYDSLINKLESSDLGKLLQIDAQTADDIADIFTKVKETLDKSKKESLDDYEDMMNKIFGELLKQAVSEEKIENADGKNVSCVVVSYTVNNETIQAVISHVIDTYYGDAKSSIEDAIGMSFADFYKEMNASVEIDLTAKLYINKKANTVAKITLDGKVLDKTEASGSAKVSAVVMLSEEKISLKGEVKADDETASIDLVLEKKVDGKNITYTLKADAGTGSTSINVLNAELALTKDGALTLNADVYNDGDSRTTFNVNGKFEVEKKSVKFEINEVKTKDATVKFTLGLVITADADIPEAPADAKDILTLTEKELTDMLDDIAESPIGKMISDMFGGNQGAPEVDDLTTGEEY